jgi:hypothetical protein
MCCLFSLVDSRFEICLMVLVPESTNGESSVLGEPFVFPSYGNIGPPHITTLSLPGLTIGLSVWLFSTQVVPNAASSSVVSTFPQEHQPHVDPSPSSLVISPWPSSLARSFSVSYSSSSERSEASNLWIRIRRKGRIRRRKIHKGPNSQPLPDMLENNQLLIIVLGVFMMPRSPKNPVSPNTLAGFVRVAIFLRISLVYPLL